jgi:hypothetical protein
VDPGCVARRLRRATLFCCNHDNPNYLDNGNPTNHCLAVLSQQRDLSLFR